LSWDVRFVPDQGEHVSSETLEKEEADSEIGDVEELLVEEVSIDGLCGVY